MKSVNKNFKFKGWKRFNVEVMMSIIENYDYKVVVIRTAVHNNMLITLDIHKQQFKNADRF